MTPEKLRYMNAREFLYASVDKPEIRKGSSCRIYFLKFGYGYGQLVKIIYLKKSLETYHNGKMFSNRS